MLHSKLALGMSFGTSKSRYALSAYGPIRRYVVNFVNSTNGTQVYASSQSFDVKTPGTPKSSDSAAQPSATSPSSSGSASSSAAASSAAGAANSNAPSGGLAQFDALAAVPVLAVTGIMTIAGVLTAF